MPGQRGSEKRQRNHVYTIRWSAVEAERLDEIVAASGCDKADVLRRLVVHDHGRIIPTRDLTREIRAVGSNLNQIARSLHTFRIAGDSASSADTLARLQAMEADFRKAHDAIVKIRLQMENWR